MVEVWKDIIDFEGYYQISDQGNVKSLDRYRNAGKGKYLQKGKYKKASKKDNGYLFVTLYKNGKRKSFHIHRLVAIHFIPNPDNKPEVNHNDGNKENNKYWNLEWCTHLENMQHANENGLFKNRKWKHLDNYRDFCNKSVKCIELNLTFKSIKTCTKYLIDNGYTKKQKDVEVARMNLSRQLNGKNKTAYGFTFEFITKLKILKEVK